MQHSSLIYVAGPEGMYGAGEAPIRLHQRHLACENTVFQVCLDHISGADGQEVMQYLSIFPKHRSADSVTGVGILPVRDGRYGLIRIFRHPMGRWSWEIPRGMIDEGEDPAQSALRELREETGYAVLPAQITEIGTAAPAAALVAARIKLFVAALAPSDVAGNADSELGLGETRFFSHAEIVDMIFSGQLEDACTLAALLMHTMVPLRPADAGDSA